MLNPRCFFASFFFFSTEFWLFSFFVQVPYLSTTPWSITLSAAYCPVCTFLIAKLNLLCYKNMFLYHLEMLIEYLCDISPPLFFVVAALANPFCSAFSPTSWSFRCDKKLQFYIFQSYYSDIVSKHVHVNEIL